MWEGLIWTTKDYLNAVLLHTGVYLDDTSFRTLLIEVKNIVNLRPISIKSIKDSEFPEPLTPNYILTMKSNNLLPPPEKFLKADLNFYKRWRRVAN